MGATSYNNYSEKALYYNDDDIDDRNPLDDLVLREPNKEEEVEQEKNHRDVVEKSNVTNEDANRRSGMQVGGASPRRKKNKAHSHKNSKRANKRGGVFKVWDDKPVNNVGQGTNQSDVSKKRQG